MLGLLVGLLEEIPDSVEFGDAPGLCVAAAWRVWRVAVEDFGDMSHAPGVEEGFGRGEDGLGGFASVVALVNEEGFRVGWEDPSPGRAVVVSGFAFGILIADVYALIWMVWVIEEVAMLVFDGEWDAYRLIGQRAYSARD